MNFGINFFSRNSTLESIDDLSMNNQTKISDTEFNAPTIIPNEQGLEIVKLDDDNNKQPVSCKEFYQTNRIPHACIERAYYNKNLKKKTKENSKV